MQPVTLFAVLVVSLCLLACALSCVGKCVPRFFHKLNLPLFRHGSVSGTSVMSSPFNYRRWSPIISGEGRIKTPLSPAARPQNRPFGDNQLSQSSLYQSSSSITHSISSSNLGQMQFDSAFYPSPHRNQMRLQSRRSQSREDLINSLADPHLGKI
nr:probable apyrase 7 [Tanacetum cinerariifolium]